MNRGRRLWIISEETSISRLTKPSTHTPRGMLDGEGRSLISSRLTQSKRLENAGGSHARPDAHGHHAILQFVPPHAVQQRGGADRAGRAERMAQRARAAEPVH